MDISRMNRYSASPHVVFGDIEYPPGGAFGPRIQRDFQLVVIYTGEARIQVEDETFAVPSQHAVLLTPHQREQFQFARAQPTHHTWCAVAPQVVPYGLQAELAQLPPCLPLTNRIHSLVEYGLLLPSSVLPAAEALLQAIGIALLHAFMLETKLAHSADLPDAVRRAQSYIEHHLNQQLSLIQIAQAAHVTPQHLIRLFRRYTQTTPTRYLWRLRVLRGVELLGDTGLSIGEIAEQVGFQSPFHFSRMVRQHYHCSPRRLRERVWRGDHDYSSMAEPE